jgi:hypothetical protein
MDLEQVIEYLYAEKARLERAIAALEMMQRTEVRMPPAARTKKRRGRKSMGPEERQEVSERMRKYWAGRRPVQTTEVPTD